MSKPTLPSSASSMPNWQRDAQDHLWMPYCQMKTASSPLPVVATQGMHLILDDGRRLIDGMGSWWTACHGYNHPHIAAAVTQQLSVMPHVMMGGIQHPQAALLATRLAALLPGDLQHVFFCDSGSVAVEVAMKMAVQFYLNRGCGNRHRFVSFRNAYHGDTTGAMSLCDPVTSMHAHFKGFLLEQYPQALPHTEEDFAVFEAFVREHSDSLAGIVIEPLIQGAGGMKFHQLNTLRGLREVCDRHDVLFIADEIATGFGRTGSMFACQAADVVPDIICLGKALTGGTMSFAATAATNRVFEAFYDDNASHALMHGPTFMGNPLACAAANASLDLFESEPRLQQARALESLLQQELQPCAALDSVVEVRARGAVGVVQVKTLDRIPQIIAAGVQRGIWIRPFKDMVYVTPPLNMPHDIARQLCCTIVDVLSDWDADRLPTEASL
ncbi:adenosylmethionine--8-amino-7-oxononanoate transaminase [Roseimaritima ulvae]|uniref:Adenosylmethionine-8-amino-7-oxononanoate aminotransferase n=1 Tax=Roseimaritima ulvae TaxID=980254 RepID=A0A5B9QPQ9_9BACT|nr:adenosylmethionine--8-amino-7-oxononanoate transaminase [Roseimaritima ulvae]QEG40998.1 Adenosylmethionine-8-amino-7-oxononanoate aminotransferase [Roseimaritima ulvae]